MTALSSQLAAKLRQGIHQHQLEKAAHCIFANVAECYAMVFDDDEDFSVTGNTRFGGEPDLPTTLRWPSDGESIYSNFIAQINFAELPALSSTPLPNCGILYLFVRSMECAAEPVFLDGIYFNGDQSLLRRTSAPEPDQMADEYLVDLQPVKIRAVPTVSFATYRKHFRAEIDEATKSNGDGSGLGRLLELESALAGPSKIGQMLGFANTGDLRQNLYRQVCLESLGQRHLTYSDYWDSMEEYEAYKKDWQDRGDDGMVAFYEKMRPGVNWLVSNGEAIAKGVAEWRLLFRIDSNMKMNLNMMDADPLYVFIRDEALARRNFNALAGEVTQG